MAKNIFSIETRDLTLVPSDNGNLWTKPWNIKTKKGEYNVGKISFLGRAEGGVARAQITINEESRRKGYGSQALKGFTDWAVGRDGIYVVEGTVYTDNEAAVALLKKNNFQEDEVIGRKARYVYKRSSIPWIPVCVCLFVSAGFAIGFTVHQIPQGLIIGAALGLVMGLIFTRRTKKAQEAVMNSRSDAKDNKNKKKKR